MAVLEVESVSVPEELPAGVRAARFRLPQAGTSDSFTLELAGMVITDGGRARAVELRCQGMFVRDLPVELPRGGLAATYPGVPDTLDCGFRGLVGTLQLPPEFELDVMAVRDDDRRFRIGSIRGRRSRPRPSFEPALRPLMLTSTGRTGTVWLMRMLAAHPGIVIQPHGTYEMWPARYWSHMLKVLSCPADHERSATSRFDHDLSHVGQNPFYFSAGPVQDDVLAWLGREHVDRLASFCLRNVEDWYAITARNQGKEPVYFAEKNFVFAQNQYLDVADLYPGTREIFSVRDPRDVACSMLSHFRHRWPQRGYDDDRALREMVVPWVRNLVASWRARGEHALLVRYEDLVREPAETLGGLLDQLELDSSAEMVDRLLKAGAADSSFDAHGTSATLEKTLGRWTREGDDAFRDMLNELFHDAVVEFGYAEATAKS